MQPSSFITLIALILVFVRQSCVEILSLFQKKSENIFLKSSQMLLLSVSLVVGLLFSVAASAIASDNSQQINESAASPEQTNEAADEAASQVENDNNASQAVPFDALSAQAWMNRLANTSKQLDFELAFVVTSPGRETLPYIWRHAILADGQEAEQLSLLNGPGFEQIRIGQRVSIFEPGFSNYSINAQAIDGPIPMAFIHDTDKVNASYEVLLMGRNRISGRMAQQLRIISKDKSRYGYHLWLDEQTGLLLKLNMYNDDGSLLEQIQVTQLSIGGEIKSHFDNIQPEQLPPLLVGTNNNEQQLGWTVGYKPVGMQIIKQNLRRVSITGEPAEYMLLSDGLVDVSVYVMSANDAINEDLSVISGTTSVVSISDGRIQVTVVGEIPAVTANKIANSIVLVSAQVLPQSMPQEQSQEQLGS